MLKWKLFLTYGFVILIVVAVVLATVYFITYRDLLENTEQSSELVFGQVSTNLSTIMDTCKSYILGLAVQDDLQQCLAEFRGEVFDENKAYNFEDIAKAISSGSFDQTGYFYPSSSVASRISYRMVVYGKDQYGDYYQLSPSIANPVHYPAKVESGEFIKQVEARTGDYYLEVVTLSATPYVAIHKEIYDSTTWEPLGVVTCEIPYENLHSSFLSPLKRRYDISAYIVAPDGVPYSFYGAPVPALAAQGRIEGNQSYVRDGYYMMEQSINHGAFYLVGILPLDVLTKTIRNSVTAIVATGVAALAFALAVSFILSRQITKPVTALSKTMQQVKDGNLELHATTAQRGEIGELYDSFNYMIEMIQELIEDNYVSLLNKKQSELSALQAQINTHFLYNTLDTVNWLAKGYNADDISLIVTSLSSLLRLSLNSGHDKITMEGELKHVRAYIEIQKIRFDNTFSVDFDVDPAALDKLTPKMLLQPLVENAIYHGFETESQNNKIIIDVKYEDGMIHERVKNTGDDIDLNKIDRLLSSATDFDGAGHYGVRNIGERLMLNYGKKAEYYYTVENGYTVAHITFPA